MSRRSNNNAAAPIFTTTIKTGVGARK